MYKNWMSLAAALVLCTCLAASSCTRFDSSGIPSSDAASDAPILDAPPDVNPGADDDDDGVINADDNCVFVANPGQEDMDSDSVGNACDNCPAIGNPDQDDRDADSIGDVCDDSDGDMVMDNADNCWQVPNGPNDAENQVDGDGDGFGNICDNCPADPNSTQLNGDGDAYGDACDLCPNLDHADNNDEDLDLVGNPCDNCPTVYNPGQEAIMDADPVGDACDPRPTMDGDSIAFFDGFNEYSLGPPTGWVVSTGPGNDPGTWTSSGGKLRQGTSGNTDLTIITRNDVGPFMNGIFGDVLIETKVTAGGIIASSNPQLGTVAAYTDVSAAVDNGFLCALDKQPNAQGGQTRLRITEFGLGNFATDTVSEFAITSSGFYTLRHYQDAEGGTNTTTCEARNLGGAGRSYTQNFGGPAMGVVGLATREISASFNYIIVYSLGGQLSCTPPALCPWP